MSYLEFEDISDAPAFKHKKTKTIAVNSKNNYFILGTIKWHGAWRQYIYEPSIMEGEIVYSNGCLKDIRDYITNLMNDRNRQ